MNILVDILVFLLITITIYFNYKKGLIEVAYKMVAFIIAIIISIFLFKPISLFIINKTTIDDNINNFVLNKIDYNEQNSTSSENNLPKIINNSVNLAINEGKQSLSYSITNTSIAIISFVLVFIVTRIILVFLHLFSDTIGKFPIIKQFNKLGGLLYGIIKSFIIVFIILSIISILPFNNVHQFISSTIFLQFLYNLNPILLFFYKIM